MEQTVLNNVFYNQVVFSFLLNHQFRIQQDNMNGDRHVLYQIFNKMYTIKIRYSLKHDIDILIFHKIHKDA